MRVPADINPQAAVVVAQTRECAQSSFPSLFENTNTALGQCSVDNKTPLVCGGTKPFVAIQYQYLYNTAGWDRRVEMGKNEKSHFQFEIHYIK